MSTPLVFFLLSFALVYTLTRFNEKIHGRVLDFGQRGAFVAYE